MVAALAAGGLRNAKNDSLSCAAKPPPRSAEVQHHISQRGAWPVCNRQTAKNCGDHTGSRDCRVMAAEGGRQQQQQQRRGRCMTHRSILQEQVVGLPQRAVRRHARGA
jgi:hypothetical protein